MPQDIPLEVSETLAFTPAEFAGVADAPSFTLRTPCPRAKRMWRRLMTEEGARTHSTGAIRDEMVRGLEAEWDAATCEQHIPMLREFWSAFDDYILQVKDDPDLKWEYDPEIEAAAHQLEQQVQRMWRPLARMRADNVEYSDIAALAQIAVMVESWDRLDFKATREGKYLTIDSAEGLREALGKAAVRASKDALAASRQLITECTVRMFLAADTEKNSASPSPSDTPPTSSKTTGRGRSAASAKSAGKTSKR